MNHLSEFQLGAGKEVISAYEKGDKPWHLLFAQPQSGKTDTFYYIAAEMLRLKKVENIVIVSGADDTQLKKQSKQSFCSTNGSMDFCEKYDRYLETELCFDRDQRFLIRSHLKSNIHFIWGNELTKSHPYTSNTLFVWDESHYAECINMRPFKFFKNIGINCSGKCVPNNNFVLSVSATPFSELSHILNSVDEPFKGKSFLKTNKNYHGIDSIIAKNLLCSFDSDNIGKELNDILKLHKNPTYAIVRCNDEEKTNHINSVAKANGWNILRCNSDPNNREINDLSILKRSPSHKSLIIIKGFCRMGQVIHKEHISFVMETANDSYAETVIQGLLGRTLGWHNHSIRVYLNKTIVTRNDTGKYIDLIQGKKILPKRAHNLNKNGTNNCDVFCGSVKRPYRKSDEYKKWLMERVNCNL